MVAESGFVVTGGGTGGLERNRWDRIDLVGCMVSESTSTSQTDIKKVIFRRSP